MSVHKENRGTNLPFPTKKKKEMKEKKQAWPLYPTSH
jgi:hypothetical protein